MTPTWPLANIFFSSAEDFFKLKRKGIVFNSKFINNTERSRLKYTFALGVDIDYTFYILIPTYFLKKLARWQRHQ